MSDYTVKVSVFKAQSEYIMDNASSMIRDREYSGKSGAKLSGAFTGDEKFANIIEVEKEHDSSS